MVFQNKNFKTLPIMETKDNKEVLHTEGKYVLSTSHNYENRFNIEIDGHKVLVIEGFLDDNKTNKANAEKIVHSVNNFEHAIDLLTEFVQMQNDPGYGDLVWRLMIKEKSEKLISQSAKL